MSKQKNEQTTNKVATIAARLLSNPGTPKAIRSVAAYALIQGPSQKR